MEDSYSQRHWEKDGLGRNRNRNRSQSPDRNLHHKRKRSRSPITRLIRDQWMMDSQMVSSTHQSSSHGQLDRRSLYKSASSSSNKNESQQKISSREANPYWKQNGTGLPNTKPAILLKNKAESADSEYMRAIMKHGRRAVNDDDDDYVEDNMASELISGDSENLQRRGKTQARSLDQVIQSYRGSKPCSRCILEDMDSNSSSGKDEFRRLRQLVASIGEHAYLSVIPYDSVAICQIVPVRHESACALADEDFWRDARNFMKCLAHMFAEEGSRVIFSECALNPRGSAHGAIDVIPVSSEIHADLYGTLQAAIIEQSSADMNSWSSHSAPIDTRQGRATPKTNNIKRGTFQSVFSAAARASRGYIHVWLDIDGGIGHIITEDIEDIDDEEKDDHVNGKGRNRGRFNVNFIREAINSLTDGDVQRERRRGQSWNRNKKEESETKTRRLDLFLKQWKPFDWTANLDGGEYAKG
jgi:Protein similar to CwfJ C-terminus 1/Protein similar to CwfJ C-terminus 2